MKIRYPLFIGFSLILTMFLLALYFYPLLPYKMAVHFSTHGVPNGFMQRFWGVFLLPFISLLLYIVLIGVVYIDPLKKNIMEFKLYYDMLIVIILLFMFYLELSLILWNIGIKLNLMRFLTIPVGILYVYLGLLLRKSKRNWFIGIRTPWTLSSDYVWDKTNKLGAKFFLIDGILVMFSFFFPRFLLLFVLWFVILSLIVTTVYSYILWNKRKTEEAK